nr:peroxiredoxin-like family protein [Roseimaritima multifibrata]
MLSSTSFGVEPPNNDGPQTPSLSQQLTEKAGEAIKRYPPEALAKMKSAVDSVRETGIEKSAKQVGDKAIDAKLSGWDGSSVQLSELWKEGPVVLMWYRGGWCPYCNLQLRAMQNELGALESTGAKLVVLTPELPANAKKTAESNDLGIVALHDSKNEIAKKYGVVFDLPESILPIYRDRLKLGEVNGSDAMELPLSATYVIDTDGVIRYAYLNADYKQRPEPSEIINFIKTLK